MILKVAGALAAAVIGLHAGIIELERFIGEAVEEGAPPSAAVAVLHRGEIVYENAFGYGDVDKKHRVTPQSVYNLYSLSKIATAVAVMQLVEEGKLSLEDEVERYFPRLKLRYNGQEKKILVGHLLTHSSGISDMLGDFRYMLFESRYQGYLKNGGTPDPYLELSYEPGSEASYANSGYVVLGYMIEQVTGMRFEKAIETMVLKPSRMATAGFVYSSEMESREVFGSVEFFSWMGLAMRFMLDEKDKNRYNGTTLWLNRFNTRWAPAGGLVGSVHDVALFLQAFERGRLFDDDTYQTFLHTPSAKVDTMFSKFDRVEFGIGWYHLEKDGNFFYQHQGIGPGFRNIMRIYPEHDLAFVILTNQTGTDIDAWADLAFEHLKSEYQ
jgi:CubicO group peptidase (beta-lactamase class C family)